MDMLSDFMSSIKPQKDGDLIDRLNYCYSTTILTVFAIFISGWSFVGTPIQCWFPAYYKGWWVEYALDYCYVQNTYFLPFTEAPVKNYWEVAKDVVQIPKNVTDREDRLIGYYQWVPFILALEAILFYLPVVIWRSLYEASGIKVKAICDTTTNAENMNQETRMKNIGVIAQFVDHSNYINEALHAGKSRILTGRFITGLYVFVKFLFALNCIGQFFMLQHFLGLKEFWWGQSILSDLINGREWTESSNFPRVTLCDFEVRVLGNLHKHTVQCVLMINMFNEKIFVFLWWWFLVVGFLGFLSFLYWLATSIAPATGERVIRNYLSRIDKSISKSAKKKKLVKEFFSKSLKPDGILLMRLVAANAGDLVASELIEALWNNFKKNKAFEEGPGANGNGSEPRKKPSAPSIPPKPVKLAGTPRHPPEYPAIPTTGYPYPPPYEDGLEEVDLPTRHRRPPTSGESSF